jgi:hypothetical protein
MVDDAHAERCFDGSTCSRERIVRTAGRVGVDGDSVAAERVLEGGGGGARRVGEKVERIRGGERVVFVEEDGAEAGAVQVCDEGRREGGGESGAVQVRHEEGRPGEQRVCRGGKGAAVPRLRKSTHAGGLAAVL